MQLVLFIVFAVDFVVVLIVLVACELGYGLSSFKARDTTRRCRMPHEAHRRRRQRRRCRLEGHPHDR